MTVALRPEQIRPADQGLSATITQLVYFGTDMHSHARLSDGTEVVARMQTSPSGEAALHEGQAITLGFAPEAIQVLED